MSESKMADDFPPLGDIGTRHLARELNALRGAVEASNHMLSVQVVPGISHLADEIRHARSDIGLLKARVDKLEAVRVKRTTPPFIFVSVFVCGVISAVAAVGWLVTNL